MTNDKESFSEQETARRRDEVIRRMANTPPQHRVTRPPRKTGKPTGAGQVSRKRGARRASKP
jgi:hypothetical protein